MSFSPVYTSQNPVCLDNVRITLDNNARTVSFPCMKRIVLLNSQIKSKLWIKSQSIKKINLNKKQITSKKDIVHGPSSR